MREDWARVIAIFTGVLVILLATVFAWLQNPDSDRTIQTDTQPSGNIQLFIMGQQIYLQQGCARCHSIAGKGNPRSPLDNVGKKYHAEEITKWIIADEELKNSLPAWAFKAKQAYRKLSTEELAALIVFLQGYSSTESNKQE